jgi:peroxiredoxin Q/BCP
MKEEFEKLWYYILWVSKDSIKSHENFITKQSLNIDLISDTDLILHKKFWAYWEKNNYGKISMWTIRSTFILNEKGEVIQEYKNVKATWHVERLLWKLQK